MSPTRLLGLALLVTAVAWCVVAPRMVGTGTAGAVEAGLVEPVPPADADLEPGATGLVWTPDYQATPTCELAEAETGEAVTLRETDLDRRVGDGKLGDVVPTWEFTVPDGGVEAACTNRALVGPRPAVLVGPVGIGVLAVVPLALLLAGLLALLTPRRRRALSAPAPAP